ncbi:hypothetical protein [Actinocorallia longicatena]|uniref:Mce-associated membrane protein n=1 Tax=Actinocorallia longicatena TaxID=111803 RepID=A0ABP6QKS8_9ACTN
MSSTPEQNPVLRAGADPEEAELIKAELIGAEEAGARPPAERPSGARGGLVAGLSAAVVALALLAGFALLQWRSAGSPDDDRAALVARVTGYGDALGTYPVGGVDAAQARVLTFLTGEALADLRTSQADRLKRQLTDAEVSLESRTDAVYIASIDGGKADVVLVFDLTFTGPGGSRTVERNHLTLGMVRKDGIWMVASTAAAGSERDSGGAVPGLGDDAPGDGLPTGP